MRNGRKYKKCHGPSRESFGGPPAAAVLSDEMKRRFAEHRAEELQRQRQQGLGRPMVSLTFQGQRVIAVGNRLYYSDKWKTFHDFLLDYIASLFGGSWGNAELGKPAEHRHPLIAWYVCVCKFQKDNIADNSPIHTAPMIGAVAAYLGLSYNLYLLSHNATLQERLIERLKNPGQFLAAVYETYVAGAFIKAGFALELEDEEDLTTSHCEFVATHGATGRRFSVEAKSRLGGKTTPNVTAQLYKALRKQTPHERVVFIEMNVPDEGTSRELEWLQGAISSIRGAETSLTIDRHPAPPAYVFLTNHSHHHHLEKTTYQSVFLAEGFKIPGFRFDSAFSSVREARNLRDRHREMFHLLDSLRTHDEIPSTFDGDIPELAFAPHVQRLHIGREYVVPTEEGEQAGILESACVSEPESTAYGVYRLGDGRRVIVATPLSDAELTAYRRYPDTFFGVPSSNSKRPMSPLDWFDFYLATYRHAPREKLVEWLGGDALAEELRNLDQEELASLYCERLVEGMISAGRFGESR